MPFGCVTLTVTLQHYSGGECVGCQLTESRDMQCVDHQRAERCSVLTIRERRCREPGYVLVSLGWLLWALGR